MNPTILVVGSSNTDMVTISDRLPKPGETVLSHQFYITQGGKGANQAVAAARLGGEVTFVARLGDDAFGKQAVAGYVKDGIRTQFISYDPEEPTGTALINIDQSGENMIVAHMGANARLSIRDVENCLKTMESVDVVLCQLEVPVETVMFTARKSHEMGKPFILNPAPGNILPDELVALCTYIIPNETEASNFSTIDVVDDNAVIAAADYFLRKGAQNVIITLGSRGALLHNRAGSKYLTAPRVKAIDTVGAGDVFCGAFALALAEARSTEDSIRFANECASLAVTRKGAQSGIPYRKEIRELFT